VGDVSVFLKTELWVQYIINALASGENGCGAPAMNRSDANSLDLAACIFVFGNGNVNTAITTFGASDMVLPIPHCIDLIMNQEWHVVIASQECFVV
jgi:hypothetical protein